MRYDIVQKMVRYQNDPVYYVQDRLKVEPDLWQRDALIAIASGDRDKIRIALSACVGPGKTTVLAWAGWWFLSCKGEPGQHPKGLAISITSDNLKDNLWAEFSKWRDRDPFLMQYFEWTKEKIFSKEYPATWFIAARSWSKSANAEEQGRTLSGLHSEYVIILVDESGEIPPPVLKAADQVLSSCKWGKILMAGNPTSHDGILYQVCTRLRNLWHVIKITSDPDDPKRTPRVDIEWAKEQIQTFGRDNPWVMSSILGEFPPTSINSLLSLQDVEASMNKGLYEHEYDFAQKRLGVDVARQGLDSSVLFPRQGLRAFPFVELKGADNNEVAARIMMAKKKWGQELEFVDGTGGFGAGVVDQLKLAGLSPREIHFASKATDPQFFNKRTEMIYTAAQWVKGGGALVYDSTLIKELTASTYTFHKGKIRVEEKEQIKKRLGFSPDRSDAFALTFAIPDMPGKLMESHILYKGGTKPKQDWDPLYRKK